ncbi:MAG TPA: aldehyde dehydrogenase (NADP(+)), partial [Verrucomicrobiales bacterium]|nr:aldehyde dehydrogenase (NADP(+)) [Verrucomicrobiales bacterium]
MNLTGHSFIGSSRASDSNTTFQVTNPTTGQLLDPAFHSASPDDLNKAIFLAAEAFQTYSKIDSKTRANFLRTIAIKIDAAGPEITPRMMAESGLPEPRCEGERGRTVGQLNMFADLIEEGSWVDARIELANPDRSPIPKPDLRSMRRPLGPVAVFCASNFPLAFSVAGGDTASALAAGCPVIVRAHAAHAGTAEIVARSIQAAVAECKMPEGTFSMIF